jgi:hypothetical protein
MPRDPVLIGGEVGVALRRGTDRSIEHRRKETCGKREYCRIRTARFFAQQKSLVPYKGGKRIDVSNREGVPLGSRVAPKSL